MIGIGATGMSSLEWLSDPDNQEEALKIIRVHCGYYRDVDKDIVKDIMDHVQDHFQRLKTIERYDPKKGSPSTYLYTCIARIAVNYIRNSKKETSYNDDYGLKRSETSCEDEVLIKVSAQKWWSEWTKTVSDRDMCICWDLIHGEESYKEIGKKYRISDTRVWVIAERMRAHCRRWYGRDRHKAA